MEAEWNLFERNLLMHSYLEFEKPVADLEGKVQELRALAEDKKDGGAVDVAEEIGKLEGKAAQALAEIYAKLSPWQKTLVARHPDRPHAIDYLNNLVDDFVPLAGDRSFGDDAAIIAGIGRFSGNSIAFLGQEKGTDTESRLKHNFGMARPEGYRKSVRIMELANQYDIPVVSFVDTAGAYPGIGAEERGQAQAIARSTDACLSLNVPNLAVIIGEGGSGGAIAIATANHVAMLEHAIYSVISPEGAASILWHDSAKAKEAATNMKITAQDMMQLKIIDEIIKEPIGGGHREPKVVFENTKLSIEKFLGSFSNMGKNELRRARHEKFLSIGRSL